MSPEIRRLMDRNTHNMRFYKSHIFTLGLIILRASLLLRDSDIIDCNDFEFGRRTIDPLLR